jgi:hypothetical protein
MHVGAKALRGKEKIRVFRFNLSQGAFEYVKSQKISDMALLNISVDCRALILISHFGLYYLFTSRLRQIFAPAKSAFPPSLAVTPLRETWIS